MAIIPRNIVHLTEQDISEGRLYHVTSTEKQSLIQSDWSAEINYVSGQVSSHINDNLSSFIFSTNPISLLSSTGNNLVFVSLTGYSSLQQAIDDNFNVLSANIAYITDF